MNWPNKLFSLRIVSFSADKCKRLLADQINKGLNNFSGKARRFLMLGIGVGFAVLCMLQITCSFTDQVDLIKAQSLELPEDLLEDSSASKHPNRVIGVLAPYQPTSQDSLLVATSPSQCFFVGNGIRWLETSLDSLKEFRSTHYYVPLNSSSFQLNNSNNY